MDLSLTSVDPSSVSFFNNKTKDLKVGWNYFVLYFGRIKISIKFSTFTFVNGDLSSIISLKSSITSSMEMQWMKVKRHFDVWSTTNTFLCLNFCIKIGNKIFE